VAIATTFDEYRIICMVVPMRRESKPKKGKTWDADEEFGDVESTGSRSSTVETQHRKVPIHHDNEEAAASEKDSFVELDGLLESIAADGKGPNAHQRRRNNHGEATSTRPNYSTAYGRALYRGRSNGSVSKKSSVPLKRRQNYKQRSGGGGGGESACPNLSDEQVQRFAMKGILGMILFSLLVVMRLASDDSYSKYSSPRNAMQRFKSRFKKAGDDASVSIKDLSLRDNSKGEIDEEEDINVNQQPTPVVKRAKSSKNVETHPDPQLNLDTMQEGDQKPDILSQDELSKSETSNEDTLPQHLQISLGDLSEPFKKPHDTPFFFHIPRSGGTVISDIMTHCLNLVTASNIGITEGRGELPNLQVNVYRDQGKYVNVDTSSTAGIERARGLSLAKSGLADVITSHRFLEAAHLFDSTYRGRAFGVFRHPVQRAVSMFYYLQMAKWEPTYDPDLAAMALEDYAVSPKAESNWLTRTLTKKFTGGLTEQHVNLAKEILRRKVLVGLMEKFDESLKRFETYFGWWENVVQKDFARVIQCQESRKTDTSTRNEVTHPMPKEESTAYQLLSQRNWADVIVYDYAVQLFKEQQILFSQKNVG
jgi:hypothetical protein